MAQECLVIQKDADAAKFGLMSGDRVVVAAAGREWTGTVTSRRLPDGRDSIHPTFDDSAVLVTFDETGVSMATSILQVSKLTGGRITVDPA